MTRAEAIENITEIKKCEAGVYAEALELAIKALEQEPCEDAISRQAVLERLKREEKILYTPIGLDYLIRAIDELPSVSTEKTDAYKQGWHDAIITALKETHNVQTEDGVFRMVQEETLIGVGMAYEQEPITDRIEYGTDGNSYKITISNGKEFKQEPKTGQWILKRKFPTKLYDEYLNEYKCSECYREIRCTESQLVNYPYCHCGAKMEVEE